MGLSLAGLVQLGTLRWIVRAIAEASRETIVAIDEMIVHHVRRQRLRCPSDQTLQNRLRESAGARYRLVAR